MDGSFHDVIERGMFSRVPTFDRYQPYQPNISQCFLLFSPRAWSKLDWFTGGAGTKGAKM